MNRDLSEIPKQLPKVAAIIVNWNSQADTLECVASLQQSTYTNLDVIVVDNGSTDGSVSAVRGQFPGVAVIENGANLGFGAACNVGIAQAMRNGADYFFLLNSDLKIDPAAIDELVAVCERDPQIGIAGPTMYLYSKPDTIQAFGGMIELTGSQAKGLYEFQADRGQLPATQEVTHIDGGIMFLRRRLVEQIGGYDSVFFLYAEEVDLAMRAMRAGYKLMVTSRAKVWHKMYGSFGGRPNTRVKYNYFRSWAILGRRYLHGLDFATFCGHYFVNRLLRFVASCVLRRTFDLIEPAIRGAYDGMREERACHPAPATFAHISTEGFTVIGAPRAWFWPAVLFYAILRRQPVPSHHPLAIRGHLEEAVRWILTAREHSRDGGIPAGFDLLRNRWASSYPETTGYTIPTLLACATRLQQPDWRRVAIALADYLLAVRTPEGGVAHWEQRDGQHKTPIVFDTGQVIFGWLAAWRETNNSSYLQAATNAADWLVDVQDESGAWVRYQHLDTVKVIDTRVSWALLEVDRATGQSHYAAFACRNLDWALSQQQPNGWFRHAAFRTGEDPFTHTIAYTAEGLLESGLLLAEPRYVAAAQQVARALLERQRPDGSLASTYNAAWQPTSRSSCLTGNCQMALLWLRFYGLSGDASYLEAARQAIAFVATTQDLHTSNANVRGAIAGSYPIYGRYGRFTYPNWAAKFFIDALLVLEEANGPLDGGNY